MSTFANKFQTNSKYETWEDEDNLYYKVEIKVPKEDFEKVGLIED